MSGRRRAPEPAIPVGGADPALAAPDTPLAAEEVLMSTEDFVPPTGAFASFEDQGEEGGVLVGEPLPPEEEVTELSPEEQVMFASLLTCGRRSKVVHILDHTVVVQTLCGDDDLRIGLYVKEYQGSLGEQRAYQIAVAAAGIRTIDGKPLTTTLYAEADNDALFQEKVAKVSKMYPTVINRIYRAVMDAEKEFVELATKLGKLDG